jgi:hypothetical protein
VWSGLRGLYLVLATVAVVQADTIITVTGGSSAQGISGSGTTAESWTSTGGFTGVTISVNIGTTDASNASGTAWLMTQIGPGTTNSQQVATTSFVAPTVANFFSSPPLTTLFTGLSLPPGTYYLVLTSPSSSVAWQLGGSVTPGIGVTFQGAQSAFSGVNSSFPPASGFSANARTFGLQVTGAPATSPVTPVPSSLLLVLTGLAAAGLLLMRRIRARSV